MLLVNYKYKLNLIPIMINTSFILFPILMNKLTILENKINLRNPKIFGCAMKAVSCEFNYLFICWRY